MTAVSQLPESSPPRAKLDPAASLDEYKLCEEKASRLEGYVWQTASIFGLGSGVGIVAVATQAAKSPTDALLPTVAAAILGAALALVWWRFARRWWSIIHLMFERMRQLEAGSGYRMASIVTDRDKEAQAHWLYMRKHGTPAQRVVAKWLQLPDGLTAAESEAAAMYEFRGLVEASRLLVIALIAVWAAIAASTAIAVKHYLEPLVAAVLFLIGFFIIWRRR